MQSYLQDELAEMNLLDQNEYAFTVLIGFSKLPFREIELIDTPPGIMKVPAASNPMTQCVIKLPELCQCDRWSMVVPVVPICIT